MKKKLAYVSLALFLTLVLSVPALAATVCKIGSKGYSSMQAAVNAVKNGQTIKVTKPITTTSTVTVPAKAKSFTIDFKNHQYSCNADVAAFNIGNKAKVTIKNANIIAQRTALVIAGGSGKNASVTIKSGKIKARHIKVDGILVVNGGSVTNMGEPNNSGPFFVVSKTGSLTITDGDHSLGIDNSGKTKITGGHFTNAYRYWITNGRDAGGEVEISGGTFAGSSYIRNLGKGKMTIKDGTFRFDEPIRTEGTSSLAISGGTFYTKGAQVAYLGADTKTTVKGGTFHGDLVFSGKATISGAKSTGSIVCMGGNVTIKDIAIDQTGTDLGHANHGACLILLSGKMTVKGGSFISPEGYGISNPHNNKLIFKVSGDYKKLFNVKYLSD